MVSKEINKVIQELGKMRANFEARAFESGDLDTEKKWNDRIDLLNEAIEYLFQYQDLMD